MTAATDTLARVPMFQGLNRKTLERLERITRERSFRAGDDIVREGDEGVGFFLILEGRVEVSRAGTHLNTLAAGDFFGEMALLDNHRRSATVRATAPTTCLAMLRSDFVAELRANAEIGIEMLEYMSRRLRELDERFADA